MGKRKLYLDIDDTVLDTENYLRKVLGGKWLNHDGLLYEEYDIMSSTDICKVINVLRDYSKIPFMQGAEDGLRLLGVEYDIVFCSSYFIELERKSKEKWAESLGIPIILCKGDTKGTIDMSDAFFVDDNTKNLDRVNACKKICFYKRHNYFNLNGNILVFDWFELVDKLLFELDE